MSCRRAAIIAGLLLAARLAAAPAAPAATAATAAAGEGAFIALQTSRQVDHVALPGASDPGQRTRQAVLTQLAPAANAWLLLSLPTADGRGTRSFHLENAEPQRQHVALDHSAPGTLLITRDGASTRCTVWPDTALTQAA